MICKLFHAYYTTIVKKTAQQEARLQSIQSARVWSKKLRNNLHQKLDCKQFKMQVCEQSKKQKGNKLKICALNHRKTLGANQKNNWAKENNLCKSNQTDQTVLKKKLKQFVRSTYRGIQWLKKRVRIYPTIIMKEWIIRRTETGIFSHRKKDVKTPMWPNYVSYHHHRSAILHCHLPLPSSAAVIGRSAIAMR